MAKDIFQAMEGAKQPQPDQLTGGEIRSDDFCPQHGYPLPCAKCGYGTEEIIYKNIGKWLREYYHVTNVILDGIEKLEQGKKPDGLT